MLALCFFAAWSHSDFNSICIDSRDVSTKAKRTSGMCVARATNKSSDALIKVFTCPDCNKSYMRYTSLRRHQRFECGDKIPQFPCPFCPYRTKQKAVLKKHILRKHADRESI